MHLETFLIENNISYYKGNLYGKKHILVYGNLDVTNAGITEYPQSLLIGGNLTMTSAELPFIGNETLTIHGYVYREWGRMDPRH